MREALAAQKATGSIDLHREWIRPLLTEYYDPMYEHQRESKAERVVFSGDRQSVTQYLKSTGY